MERKIKTIQPAAFMRLPKKKRVAAYARVSSGKDAMLHSLAAQTSYYSSLIQSNPEWEYAGVYADEALTGTKADRPEFQRLLADCRVGKIDIVITKSMSRFARNTITSLEAIRMLRSIDVDVFFEEHNLHTASEEGELLLTLLAAYAEEESRSVSDNMKWRLRKGFAEGQLLNWRFQYGYRIAKDFLEVDPDEAPVVREIFDRFLAGDTLRAIANDLNEQGRLGRFGGQWCAFRVRCILANEKYAGNALLQKSYVNNHIEKRQVKNEGQIPMYYAEGTHPAIISQETFDRAHVLLARLEGRYRERKPREHSAFTSKIICEKCGRCFRRKMAGSAPKYRKLVWICTTFNDKGKAACPSKQIPDDILTRVTAQVLGLDHFDEAVFAERIREIRVPENGVLKFIFNDGAEVTATWENTPHKDAYKNRRVS